MKGVTPDLSPYYAGANPIRSRDPLGLIEWKCDFSLFGGGEVIGGGILKATCDSPCANGKQRHVILEGVLGGITFGLPVGINIASGVAMEDGADTAIAANLVGYSSYHSGGAAFIVGCGQTDFKLGKAKGSSSGCSWWAGFGGGLDNYAGDMEIKADVPKCCK